MTAALRALASVAWLLALTACPQEPEPAPRRTKTSSPAKPSSRSAPAAAPSAMARATSSVPQTAETSALGRKPKSTTSKRQRSVELLVGGDVSFGRMRGERLLRQPQRNDFSPLAPWFTRADLRFVNLESPLSDHPLQGASKMVFSGPPIAADALRRANIDIVSLANNHAWDYGKDGLFQTMANLDRVGIRFTGAVRQAGSPHRATIVEKNGLRLAFLAVTEIWNQSFSPHPGKAYIADAKQNPLLAEIRRIRASVDYIIVSHHGGYEYVDEPHPGTTRLLRAAMRAGADVVVGHHPHVVQRVALVAGKPLFYSLGNLLMRMASNRPWTEFGMIARIRLRPGGTIRSRLCPYRIHGLEPLPLARDPRRKLYETHFRFKFEQLQRAGALIEKDAPTGIEAFDRNGCAKVVPIKSGKALR